MVNEFMKCPRCRACSEVNGNRHGAYVFCAFLNQDVWGDSIQCPHGENLSECF